MAISANSLDQIATPSEVAELIRGGVETGPEGTHVSCPTCESNLWIVGNSFICTSTKCAFFTGGIIDYLAFLHNGDYEQGVDLLFELFPARLKHIALPQSILRNDAIRTSRYDRELIDMLRPREESWSNAHLSLLEYFLRHNIQSDVLRMTAAPLVGSELEQILAHLSSKADVPQTKQRGMMAIPFLERHHRVESILFLNPESNHHFWVKLQRSRFGYAGLWQHHNPDAPVAIHRDVHEALSAASHSQYQIRTHLAVMANAKQGVENAGIRRPTFVVGALGDLASAALFWEEHSGALFRHTDKPGPPLPWFEFVFRQLVDSLNQKTKQPSSQTYNLLDAVRWPSNQLNTLITCARAEGYPVLADELERLLRMPVIYDSRNLRVQQTENGYVAFNQGEPEMLSNFTISFEHSTSFPERQSLYFNGVMSFAGKEYPFMLPQASLSNLRSLLEEMQRRTALDPQGLQGIPFLATSPHLRYLQTYWQREISQLPCRTGLPFLGWSARRDEFYAPGWQAGLDGIQHQARPFHPDVLTLDCFEQTSLPETPYQKLPRELADLISSIVANLVRAKLHYPMRPVTISQDANSSRVIPALFRGLGQTRPITNPEHAAGIQFFPAYSFYPLRPGQLESLPQPYYLILPGKYHWTLQTVPSDESLELAANLLHRLVFRTVEVLLETPDLQFDQCRHVFRHAKLVNEGHQWITEHLGIDWPKGPQPLQHVQRAIEAIPLPTLGDAIRYEAGSDPRALIRKDHLAGDLVDIELELRWLDPTLRDEGNHFSMAYPELARLLQTYHGQHTALPAPDKKWLSTDPEESPALLGGDSGLETDSE